MTGRPANPFFRDPLFWLALIAIGLVTPALALLPGIVLAPSWPGTPAFVLFVVVYPVLEEVVFRAGLHYGLLRRWPPQHVGLGLSRANCVTAAVFALAHLWAHPPLWALATALPALMFGAFFERHGQRLGAPIVLHGVCNAMYFLVLS